MIVCGDFFYFSKYLIEQLQFEVPPCPTRSIVPWVPVYAGTHAEPL